MFRAKRIDALIGIFWGLILVKSMFVVWLVDHYKIPFNPMWVVGPTVAFAFVATAAYYIWRE